MPGELEGATGCAIPGAAPLRPGEPTPVVVAERPPGLAERALEPEVGNLLPPERFQTRFFFCKCRREPSGW